MSEYSELEQEDQQAIDMALDRAIATFQDFGLAVEHLDHSSLREALTSLFVQATA